MDELEARAHAQLNGLHDFGDKLGSIRVCESSPDDLVSVEVDGVGALVALRIAPGAERLGAARLAELIVTTAALGAQRALAERAAITEEFDETFRELLQSRPHGI